MDQIKCQPNRGFKTRDPKRRLVKLEGLLVEMMWRMVRRDGIDRSVLQCFQNQRRRVPCCEVADSSSCLCRTPTTASSVSVQ